MLFKKNTRPGGNFATGLYKIRLRYWIYLSYIPVLLFINGCAPEQPKEVNAFPSNRQQTEGLYHTLDEIYAELTSLRAKNPHTLMLFDIGKSEIKQRPIPMARIGIHPDKTIYKILLVAGTHGDEAAPVEALLYIINQSLALASGPDSSIFQKMTLDVVPVHNPDGYFENERENAAGVDLNRNFPFGFKLPEVQSENRAIINLANLNQYDVGLFFHSANEEKYENLIRIPLELKKTGPRVLLAGKKKALNALAKMLVDAGNRSKPSTSWRTDYTLVDAPGIASDWMVSGFIDQDQSLPGLAYEKPIHPSLALTLEICYPKQPMKKERLLSEKMELWEMVNDLIKNYSRTGEPL